MVNNIASSGLWENVTLSKVNTYHRWPHIYAEGGLGVEMCATNGDVARQSASSTCGTYGVPQHHNLVLHTLVPRTPSLYNCGTICGKYNCAKYKILPQTASATLPSTVS